MAPSGTFHVPNPAYADAVAALFADAPFVAGLGIRLLRVTPGGCEALLELGARHHQHLGRAHGGVLTTLAGHAALGAATSLIGAGEVAVAPELSLRLLRPATAGELLCRAEVIKAGAQLIFVEATVRAGREPDARVVARGSFTFARRGRD